MIVFVVVCYALPRCIHVKWICYALGSYLTYSVCTGNQLEHVTCVHVFILNWVISVCVHYTDAVHCVFVVYVRCLFSSLHQLELVWLYNLYVSDSTIVFKQAGTRGHDFWLNLKKFSNAITTKLCWCVWIRQVCEYMQFYTISDNIYMALLPQV